MLHKPLVTTAHMLNCFTKIQESTIQILKFCRMCNTLHNTVMHQQVTDQGKTRIIILGTHHFKWSWVRNHLTADSHATPWSPNTMLTIFFLIDRTGCFHWFMTRGTTINFFTALSMLHTQCEAYLMEEKKKI